jgi:hypothetical protein
MDWLASISSETDAKRNRVACIGLGGAWLGRAASDDRAVRGGAEERDATGSNSS